MSTRSLIGIADDEGKVTFIYCHSDGYESYMVPVLTKAYRNEAKVRELVDLGDLSVLADEIGVKHPFYESFKPSSGAVGDGYDEYTKLYGKMCLAYHRDRGEERGPTQAKSAEDAAMFLLQMERFGAEHAYLFKFRVIKTVF